MLEYGGQALVGQAIVSGQSQMLILLTQLWQVQPSSALRATPPISILLLLRVAMVDFRIESLRFTCFFILDGLMIINKKIHN
jgi:hypothetical protein